jgi:hypothetical protein
MPLSLSSVVRLLVAASLALGSALAAPPEPTPTPAPKLTGGFGKVPVAPRSAARETGKSGPLRITNDSLVVDPSKGKVSTSQRPAATTPDPARTAAPSPAALPAVAGADAGQGEAYWRDEARRLRERVAELREAIVRLEADTKRLEADYYAWDDGAYRDRVIKPSWDKAREELATSRFALPVAEKELSELPDRGRRAGALPGWLRE